MHYHLADTIATTCHNDNLVAPHIRVVLPVVDGRVAQPIADRVEQSQADQCLQVLECRGMFGSEDIPLLRVARGEDEGKRERGIECRQLDEVGKGVAGEPYTATSVSMCSN